MASRYGKEMLIRDSKVLKNAIFAIMSCTVPITSCQNWVAVHVEKNSTRIASTNGLALAIIQHARSVVICSKVFPPLLKENILSESSYYKAENVFHEKGNTIGIQYF